MAIVKKKKKNPFSGLQELREGGIIGRAQRIFPAVVLLHTTGEWYAAADGPVQGHAGGSAMVKPLWSQQNPASPRQRRACAHLGSLPALPGEPVRGWRGGSS